MTLCDFCKHIRECGLMTTCFLSIQPPQYVKWKKPEWICGQCLITTLDSDYWLNGYKYNFTRRITYSTFIVQYDRGYPVSISLM
jgi:hypothetical protein